MKTYLRSIILIVMVISAATVFAATAVVEKDTLSFESPVEGGKVPWTGKEFANARENFQFAIVSDRTGGHRPGVFARAVGKLNLLQPEFVICVGDLIEGYTEDQKALDAMRNEFDALVDKLDMPFFYVPGNHDASNTFMLEDFKKRYGRSYYSFTYGGALFLCLCTEDPTHMVMGDDQIAYMKKALEDNKDARWTFVFMHNPLWQLSGADLEKSNWPKMEEMLDGRKYTVFAGHLHVYTKETRNDRDYIVLSTTGGTRGRTETGLGELDHIVWVTMDDEEPKIANIVMDSILSKNFVTKESRAVVESFIVGNAVNLQPLFTDQDTFTSADIQLTLTNSSDAPAKYSVRLSGGPKLAVKPASIDQTLQAHSTKSFPVKLTASEKTSLDDLPAATAEWTIEFTPPEGDLLVAKGSRKLGVEKIRFVGKEHIDDFSAYKNDADGRPAWLPVVGEWKMQDGEYHQVQKQGYDRFSTADVCVKGDYRIETKVRLIEGSFDPGFMFNMASRKSTGATQMVRFAGFANVWCGNFSPNGIYTNEHTAPTGLENDKGWVTLAVDVHNSKGTYDVEVNGKTVAKDQKLMYVADDDAGRCIALIACNGHMAYDYFKVTPLDSKE